MLRLDKVIKPWKESAALNDHINLYGFWNETAFLTKSGDVGMILSVPGVDYESLDRSEQEYAVKRLEAALKAFGPGFHVYQYLFKSNRPDIPFATYDDPIVDAAIDQRRKFFEAKRDHLYQVEIFYCILLEGARSKTGVGTALARLLRDPEGAIAELKSQFTNDNMKKLLRTHIERDLQRLDQHVQAFARQLADFMQIEVLNRQGQFTFFRRLLNYDDWRVAGRPQSTQFLDYQVVNSDIEAERDHLRVGDHIVRVLTMKEAITETRPLDWTRLLKISANFYVVTEWTPLPADKARKEVNKRRRHFNMSKTGFVSQMGNDTTKTNPRDVLVDESKQADIENLGDCLRALGDGQSLGDFSLTIVLYGRSRTELDQLVAEFTGIFTNADGNLFAETYNQLNAYFATVPGNYALNLRKLYLLNTNYADLSFLFTILTGEKTNEHLGTEYLAVVETDNSTPYFLNLHTRDVAHTLILGMTGSGKNMKLEEVNTRTKEAVDFLVAALESGHSEVLTAYLGAMAKFHSYSFGNIMLIARQKPDATNVAGLRTWNSLGRFVKRGEKGIFILAPMVRRRSTKDVATDEPSEDATTEGQRTLYGFRAVYVFDRLSRDLRPSLCALDRSRGCHFRSPLDSSRDIIAQLRCPVQRVPNASVQLSLPFIHQSEVLSAIS